LLPLSILASLLFLSFSLLLFICHVTSKRKKWMADEEEALALPYEKLVNLHRMA
jgi:hypothetical protein